MTVPEAMIEGRPAHEVLAWSRDLLDAAMRPAVDTLPSSMRHIAGYHFGWWDEKGQPVEADPGKALRPALVLLMAEAAHGAASMAAPAAGMAAPAAAAVELVHNFSLLHDDVIDRDETRRHRPTAWSVFGDTAAILAGDALLTLAFDVLARSGHPAAVQGAATLGAAVLDLTEGQHSDVCFEGRGDVGLAECLGMAEKKTGALLGCACALGGLFGGAGPEQVEHMRLFGDRMGLAFQIADDLLGIWGDPEVTGKPVFSDLRNRKKSLPVVAALTSGTDAGRELAEVYAEDRPLSGDDLVRTAALIESAGGLAWSRAQADDLLAQALGHLRSAGVTARAAAELSALARMATRRDH
ncbi:dimethylallyltransferase [Microtetraspora sp. NBRC 13810]|uniref:family 2 encapsulin nanocompartment cargo protein polyprenyl transferase n=1 Tax=Microtetraspora sp. NBRC 13810 TaxID=3030990 RepID=UPI0025542484|nr:family 2 encapsulin nanocompartment cargo protein polyprenyl transferase [Microtetraspora sp. NBRC 13810]GLW09049.1 dimethylallyltransferase [Microtetraspora sp. NBRC 13810]